MRRQPSFQNGFARSIGESVRPDLWPDHAWVPMLGLQGGMVFDVAGGKHGPLTGTPPLWTPSRHLSLDFNHTAARYVDCPGTRIGATGQLSAFALFNRRSSAAADIDAWLVSAWNSGTSKRSYGLMANAYATSNQFSFATTRDGLIGTAVKVDTPATDGVWKTLCGTVDTTATRLYEDGFLKASGAGQSTIYYDAAQPTCLGFRYNSATRQNFYNGLLAVCYLYPRSLTGPEVLLLHADPLLPFRRRIPKRYWVVSGGAGATLTLSDIADAVWEHSTRTTDGLSPAASDGSYLDDIGYAVWTAATRTVDSTATIIQSGFRFRNDDGSESSATWKALQDTAIALTAGQKARIRVQVDATGNPEAKQFQLEYRHKPVGQAFSDWTKVE